MEDGVTTTSPRKDLGSLTHISVEMSSIQLFDPPYLTSGKKAPKTVNKENLFGLLCQINATEKSILIVALLGGIIYFCFSPLFDLIGYIKLYIESLSIKQSGFCKTDARSCGVISQRKCSRTNRTYITRFVDSRRDISDCSQLLVTSFNKDPFSIDLQPDIGARHLFGAFWYKALLESPNYDVIVEEWAEEEKIVGILVYTQRKHCLMQAFFDYSKWLANIFRFLFINSCTSYRQALMVFAMELKLKEVSEKLNLKNIIHAKFLGVEKGFQGQGIGSSLLKTVSSHVDALKRPAYLESSNVANVPLYERFGFRMIEEWSIFPGCSPLYLMVRPAVLRDDDSTTVSSRTTPTSASTPFVEPLLPST